MDDKRELTKDLLTSSFKELIMTTPFDKIIIKNITDRVGVIRPTFYKHFQDKYEILEWILKKEIADKIQILLDNDMSDDVFKLLCNCLEKDKALYKKLYEIEGQNSFERLMNDYIYSILLSLLQKYPLKSPEKLTALSKEATARFYTFGLCDSLKYWVTEDSTYSAEELNSAYEYLIRNSITDILDIRRSR